jgi:hypothetical protein
VNWLLFEQHVALVGLFGAIVLVEHWWTRHRSKVAAKALQESDQVWRNAMLADVQAIKHRWGVVASDYEDTRDTVTEHTTKLADHERRLAALEADGVRHGP